MTTTIRAPIPADAEAMGFVHVRAWQDGYRGIMPNAYLDDLMPSERAAMWARAIASPSSPTSLLVTDVDGTVVGFAAFGAARGDSEDEQHLGELYSINFDPRWWGRGLGRALLVAVTNDLVARGFQEAVLWVTPGNGRARALYEAAGWRDDGVARDEELLGVTVTEMRYRRSLGQRLP